MIAESQHIFYILMDKNGGMLLIKAFQTSITKFKPTFIQTTPSTSFYFNFCIVEISKVISLLKSLRYLEFGTRINETSPT